MGRPRDPVGEQGKQALPSGEQLRLVARLRQQAECVREGWRHARRRTAAASRARLLSRRRSGRSPCSGRGSRRAPRGPVGRLRPARARRATRRGRRTRSAEPALKSRCLDEGRLHGVQRTRFTEALDRVDTAAVRLQGEHEARAHRLAVEEHGARTTDTVLAAEVRSGEPVRSGSRRQASSAAPASTVAALAVQDELEVDQVVAAAPSVRSREPEQRPGVVRRGSLPPGREEGRARGRGRS